MIYTNKEEQARKECPITELSYLILEHAHITLSQRLLVALSKAKVAVIICDERHLPHGLMLPLAGHYLHSERARCQWALTYKKYFTIVTWRRAVHKKHKPLAGIGQALWEGLPKSTLRCTP